MLRGHKRIKRLLNSKGIPLFAQSQIRAEVIFADAPKYPPSCRRPQYAMVGKMHPAEKVHAGSKGLDAYFVWVER